MFRNFKIFSIIFVICIAFIPNISFADNKETIALKPISIEEQLDIANFGEFVSGDKFEINNGVPEVQIDEIKSFSSEILSTKSLSNSNRSGDIYEPNDSSDKATPIYFNSRIKANLHTEADQDWYKFNITKNDVDNCPMGIFSVILKNIPAGKDYDMYLFKRLPNGGMGYTPCDKLSNSVASHFNITEGSYLIAVFSKDNIPNNYSAQNYELYVGNGLIPRSTEYMNTNMEFNFGFNHYPVPYLCKPQYIDLSNDSSLPVNSIIKKVRLTSDGNGAYWIGLKKRFDDCEAQAGIDIIPVPEYSIWLKENHSINAYITKSNGFVWRPRLQIDYVYPLIESNYKFYFGR